jgi:hypothetical protein
MEEEWSHLPVVGSCVVLRVVVGAVDFSGFPKDMKVALADAVANPVETHVDGA